MPFSSDVLEYKPSSFQNQKPSITFIKDYFFKSKQKWTAWLFLLGIILCIIALVGLAVAFSWWSGGFWAILTAKEWIPFFISMGQFAGLLLAYVGFNVLKNHLLGKLSIRWRDWLTHKILCEYLGQEENQTPYLDLLRHYPEMEGIAQRIQEDVSKLVHLTLKLASDFFKSILSLSAFAGSLWVIGGSFAFVVLGLNLIIPGYLFWATLIISVVATAITHWISRSLVKKNQNVERAESDFRQTLGEVGVLAENIAEEHAEGYYKITLTRQRQDILNRSNQKLNTQSQLVGFQNFYLQLSTVIPYLLATPLFFADLIGFEQLTQIAISFMEVNESLNTLMTASDSFVEWKASKDRVNELQQALQTDAKHINPKEIKRIAKAHRKKPANEDTIHIKGLTLFNPIATEKPTLFQGLNLRLRKGEHTFIKAKFDFEKSTLFRAISGTWEYGEGKITLPKGESLYFLPQKPTLPSNTTLKQVLAFPDPEHLYSDERCQDALMAVGMQAFSSLLAEKRTTWKTLSGGEQEMIGFARMVLKKPDRLFLDEATALMDVKSEKRIYGMIKRLLPNTTIVSIAHRDAVKPYHSRILSFKADADKNIVVKEKGSQSSLQMQ